MPKIKGTDGDDQLQGTELRDIILGYAGNDTLVGLGGNDEFRPGTGADTVLGGDGNDIATFENLDSAQPDTFDGGLGTDTLDLTKTDSPFFHLVSWYFDPFSKVYSAEIFGDSNTALTFSGVEHLIGSHEDDQFSLSFSTDALTIEGGRGNDSITAGDGDDVLMGGDGDDFLYGGAGEAKLFGGAGQDRLLMLGASTGLIDGGDGSDTAVLAGDADLSKGVAHNAAGDRITLRSIENVSITLTREDSLVHGTDGRNVLDASGSIYGATFVGGKAADVITGGDGSDRIRGDEGADVLGGGFGADQLTGGSGTDRFVFFDDALKRAFATDRVTDFSQREYDQLDVSGIDANTDTDTLNAFRFIGAKAFGKEAGELRYEIHGSQTRVLGDTDGDGRADFAIQLDGKITLEFNDFVFERVASADLAGPAGAPGLANGHAFTPYVDGVLP